jgi:uncharacterized protein
MNYELKKTKMNTKQNTNIELLMRNTVHKYKRIFTYHVSFIMYDYKNVLVAAALLLAVNMVQGQGSVHSMEVLTNIKKDSIQVRWAPTSTIVWQLGNKYGYILERYTIARDGKLIDNPKAEIKTLATAPLKPMSESDMETLAVSNDYIAMVKGCIYNEEDNNNSSNKSGGFGALLMGKDELEIRYGFALLASDLSIEAAKAHGLYFVDKEVKATEKYAYRVSIAQQPKGLIVKPAIGIGALNEPNKLNPPRELGINITNDMATLRWLINLDRGKYSAYIIERSVDGKNFTRINDKPYVTAASDKNKAYAFYKDSMPADNINYQYRMKGITPFAEEGPYSNVVGGKVTPDISIPIIDSIGLTNKNTLYLHWTLADDVKKITKEIYVTRSPKVTGPFVHLNPKPFKKNADNFIDEKPNQNNYYRIKVITTNNKTVYSVPNLGQVSDSIAPNAPTGVKAVIDSNGIVKITWAKNTEKDLLGYRVFKSNTADQDYIEEANRIIKKTSYVDTVAINTLSKKVFYKIAAVDKNYNPSEYSLPVELKRPDKIAPVAAVFTKVVFEDSASQIDLVWIPSSSSDDLTKQILVRKKIQIVETVQNGKTVNTANVLETKTMAVDTTGKLNRFSDNTGELGSTYAYWLYSYDAAGNNSHAFSGELFYETGRREALQNITAVADKIKNVVMVRWEKPKDPAPVSYYIIFKAVNNNKFYRVHRISMPDNVNTSNVNNANKKNDIANQAVLEFVDNAVETGSVLQYAIKVYFKNNTSTKLSKPVKVNF